MGQKVHPTGMRLGFNKTWRSRWFASREYADLLHEEALAEMKRADAGKGGLAQRDLPGIAERQVQSVRGDGADGPAVQLPLYPGGRPG